MQVSQLPKGKPLVAELIYYARALTAILKPECAGLAAPVNVLRHLVVYQFK